MNKKNEDLEKLIAFSKLNEECKGCGRLKNNGGQCKGKRQGPPCCITRKGRKMLFLFFIAFLASSIFFTPITGEAIVLNDKIPYSSYTPIDEKGEVEEGKTDKYSYLIKNTSESTETHVFDKKTKQYLYTIVENENEVKEYKIKMLEHENYMYKEAGFKQLPDIHVVNSPEYEWFIDQNTTGRYSSQNCGPSSIAMAMNWLSKDSTTAEEVRDEIKPQGGGLMVDEITEYLKEKDIKYYWLGFNFSYYDNKKLEKELTQIIEDKDIALIFINSSSLEENKAYLGGQIKIGKPYEGGGPHVVVLMGYLKTNGEIYYELYDPAISYGKGIFVKSNNLIEAMKDFSSCTGCAIEIWHDQEN
mgnify:CR=1 FL=1